MECLTDRERDSAIWCVLGVFFFGGGGGSCHRRRLHDCIFIVHYVCGIAFGLVDVYLHVCRTRLGVIVACLLVLDPALGSDALCMRVVQVQGCPGPT